jgi:hypothetical protein
VDTDLSVFRKDFDGSAFATHVEGEDLVTARGSESIKVYNLELRWHGTPHHNCVRL